MRHKQAFHFFAGARSGTLTAISYREVVRRQEVERE
jgi:hypothetical protein